MPPGATSTYRHVMFLMLERFDIQFVLQNDISSLLQTDANLDFHNNHKVRDVEIYKKTAKFKKQLSY